MNDLARTGIAPRGKRAKASQVITNVVAANSTLPLMVSGSEYYVIVASAPIQLRPSAAGSVGFFDSHTPGTGKVLGELNAFDMLEVKNENAFAVIFQIFVGWDEYIDKRLILANQSTPQVAYPTYTTPSSAALVDITDRAGQAFTDINGGRWYALNRVAIIISNTDSGVTLLVQRAATVVANGPAIAAVQPLTSIRLDVSGNYRLHLGGAMINAIVSEIYAALPNPA